MIVLHPLAYSRGRRILWLLEDLKLGYKMMRYERDKHFKAPAAARYRRVAAGRGAQLCDEPARAAAGR